jgi:hypothetical protein
MRNSEPAALLMMRSNLARLSTRWIASGRFGPVMGAVWLLSVTGSRWWVMLTRRGMPRLSDLLPDVAEPGGPVDDLDAWLEPRHLGLIAEAVLPEPDEDQVKQAERHR